MTFDRFIMVDWSARSKPAPKKPTKDAIFFSDNDALPVYARTRQDAMHQITERLDAALAAGERVLIGFDFAFGYPSGFAARLGLPAKALAVWNWLASRIEDDATGANNRWAVAREINDAFPGVGPMWGCPAAEAYGGLPEKGRLRKGTGQIENRLVEDVVKSAQSTLKLFTTGSVGSQILMGIPHLVGLRRRYGEKLSVWPLETGPDKPASQIVLVEIYPALLGKQGPLQMRPPGWLADDPIYRIPDAVQVRALSERYRALDAAGDLTSLFSPVGLSVAIAREEGWILGVEGRAN